jgi:hypothetical protein
MEWLAGVVDQIFTFFQFVWDFMSNGIYTFVRDALAVVTKALVYSWVSTQLFALDIAYEAAKGIVSDLGISSAVRSYYGGLPGEVSSALSFFGVPQALNMIFSALSTRFVLRFVPFFGR